MAPTAPWVHGAYRSLHVFGWLLVYMNVVKLCECWLIWLKLKFIFTANQLNARAMNSIFQFCYHYLLNIFLDILLDKVSFLPSLSLEVSLLNLFFICRKLTIFTSISFSFSDRITFCWTASINWELTLKYLDMTGTNKIFPFVGMGTPFHIFHLR